MIIPETPLADFIVDIYDGELRRTPFRRVEEIIDTFRPFSVKVDGVEVSFGKK